MSASYISTPGYLRKVLPCPNKVLKLAHWFLRVLTTASVHVSVEDTSDLSLGLQPRRLWLTGNHRLGAGSMRTQWA